MDSDKKDKIAIPSYMLLDFLKTQRCNAVICKHNYETTLLFHRGFIMMSCTLSDDQDSVCCSIQAEMYTVIPPIQMSSL